MNNNKIAIHTAKELIYITLLLFAIATVVSLTFDIRNRVYRPDTLDMHQQQEMLDYHHSQGHNIALAIS